ncbi:MULTISPECIES: Hpt domain-containing protein [Anaerotruncus]|uniref:Hpt domain-containing protein n=1 Tax=Anaerotruncus TaxID=244127 RepID=UPI000835745C|nr:MULTISPECIES: Hpt domain-containing protein [Anaerotruncus]RGX54553.1 Hpt domain-containing protein [Anaerotruncus sp. AF02-27]
MEFKEVIGHINLDENAVLERFSGNRALMERFIRKFPEDKTYMELCAAVDANDAEEILRAAHTLKGVTANLGLQMLYADCSKMVEDLRADRDQAVQENFARISKEYQSVVGWLSRLG